jgi:4-amino-4-deoxy-L-arabinose transferase-like glycosyltransferase
VCQSAAGPDKREEGRRVGTGSGSPLPRRLAVVALGLALYWAGNARTPLWDRDEPRFAQAAREMRERGDLVVPTFGGEGRYHKPPFAYWTILAGTALLGDGPFAARAGSGLLAALAALAAGLLARDLTRGRPEPERDRAEAWSALAALTAPLAFGVARLAIADGALLLWVVLVQWTGLRLIRGWGGLGSALAFWAAMAAGILTKGPIAPMVYGATLIAARCLAALPAGWARRHRPALGVPLLLALTLPWAVAAQARTGGAFLREAIGVHVIERSLRPFEGHGVEGVLGYLAGLPAYLVLLPLLTLPWSVPGLVGGAAWWRSRERSFEGAFLAGWIVGPLVVFSLVATKLPHYVAPLAPAIAVAAGLWLAGGDHAAWWRGARRSLAGGYGVLAIAVAGGGAWAGGSTFAGLLDRATRAQATVGLACCVAALVAAGLWSLRVAQRRRWAVGLLAATVLFELALAWLVLPAIGRLSPWQAVARDVRERGDEGAPVLVVGEPEPGLVYALGAMPRVIDESEAIAILRDGAEPGRILIADRRAVGPELAARLHSAPAGGVHTGIALAKGRRAEMVVLRR